MASHAFPASENPISTRGNPFSRSKQAFHAREPVPAHRNRISLIGGAFPSARRPFATAGEPSPSRRMSFPPLGSLPQQSESIFPRWGAPGIFDLGLPICDWPEDCRLRIAEARSDSGHFRFRIADLRLRYATPSLSDVGACSHAIRVRFGRPSTGIASKLAPTPIWHCGSRNSDCGMPEMFSLQVSGFSLQPSRPVAEARSDSEHFRFGIASLRLRYATPSLSDVGACSHAIRVRFGRPSAGIASKLAPTPNAHCKLRCRSPAFSISDCRFSIAPGN